MELRRSLRELGLTKYETDAYLNILTHGIAEASTIYKEAKIPFGKIYETLNILISKGLIEVQNTRPKKYKARSAKVAFDHILKMKKEDMEKDLQKTRDLIMQVLDKINKINVKQPEEKIFWTTAVGSEVVELVSANFEEAKKEICICIYHEYQHTYKVQFLKNMPFIMDKVIKASLRGIKIRVLASEEMMNIFKDIFRKLNGPKEALQNIYLRTTNNISTTYFTIIDSEKVVLQVDDPTDPSNTLAMTKIWDEKLARRIEEKFNEMWEEAKLVEV
ncbi:MAG: TrmB family transcriptional regulator [ANME-2 cluster archaeon]|nr:TrmB family transcriptional regulator [ANME-2 cluster archaeon]MBC2701361.1 TrmB family transcriptional regulator [ANME-2 cluster archaeon]MBC2708430.1 TrmB family transcriptional regulator [ANME-2 cluster archaeon]MBC2745675.1 TrmB family transcriptional regulator [ANME-2 cluster archaeon]